MATETFKAAAGKMKYHSRLGNTSDPWRDGAVATPNGKVQTKAMPIVPRGNSAVPVKNTKPLPGNQGASNAHTKPGAIKPVGPDTGMRKTESVTTTRTLAKMYPTATKKGGA
jgi:hypothetical protein